MASNPNASWRAVRPKKGQTCRFFKTPKGCPYGGRCKFVHDPAHAVSPPPPDRGDEMDALGRKSKPQPSATSGPEPSRLPESQKRRYESSQPRDIRDWKRLLYQARLSGKLAPVVVQRFLATAVDLLEGNVADVQEVIKAIATNEGLGYVKAVADDILVNEPVHPLVWTSYVLPLFRLLTHPSVEASTLLEIQVTEIVNFLAGPAGRRMKVVFEFALALLERWGEACPGLPFMDALEVTVKMLVMVFDASTTNLVNQEFRPLSDRLVALFRQSDPAEDAISSHRTGRRLEYLQRRLGLAEGIIVLGAGAAASAAAPTPVWKARGFELARDLPGHLSNDGPRHDNDFPAIADIRILPTYDEIMSVRAEYLPTNDPAQSHLGGIEGLLDRHFRLLREDTVGQLRDAVRVELERRRRTDKSQRQLQDGHAKTAGNQLRTFAYEDAVIIKVSCDRLRGLELVVSAEQPASVKNSTNKGRKDWWQKSKRLQPGALVCVINSTDSVLFCVVAESTLRSSTDAKKRYHTPRGGSDDEDDDSDNKEWTLCDNPNHLVVRLHLVNVKDDGSDVMAAMDWYMPASEGRPPCCLVEFPGVLLDSFQHTLAGLQQQSSRLDIPFAELLAPAGPVNDDPKENYLQIPAPLYSQSRSFYFDLGCLTKGGGGGDGGREVAPALRHRPDGLMVAADKLTEHSSLDATQSEALLQSLNRGFSCIQGPPGTGKSYTGQRIIQVLLANAKKATLGPILCVCYTNHALDQLLEHLLDDGINQILRIGSRSRSERLTNYNLRTKSREMTKTRAEKETEWGVRKQLTHLARDVNTAVGGLTDCASEATLQNHLENSHPMHHDELFKPGEDGWTVVERQHQVIKNWLRGGSDAGDNSPPPPPRSVEVLQQVPLNTMTRPERALLHSHWIESLQKELTNRIVTGTAEFRTAKSGLDGVYQEVNLRCLLQADVVGVTTTGLARSLGLLRKLNCKVLICEEAGEVLEAHVLTALLPSIEHVILIGDHEQLRPQIQNYELQVANPTGVQHSLDVSLFERLVRPPNPLEPKIPFSVLKTQRRMHPSISSLIRNTIYPHLEDADATSTYPSVAGIRRRLFWLHHTNFEDRANNRDPLQTSRTNQFEIDMVVAMASHLVRQGMYRPGDIAVLTPYLGQLHKLCRAFEDQFELDINDADMEDLAGLESEEGADGTGAAAGSSSLPPLARQGVVRVSLGRAIRAATVDRFQGDEAKVVIISLVRSNEERQCGFLKTSNRINVLLSRAQHGMYIIGNAETYAKVNMWRDVLAMLKDEGNVGTELELRCPRHPDTPIQVSEPDHFVRFTPDGGCQLPCDRRLLCGHPCTGSCHAEVIHRAVKCPEPCPRPKKDCEHACPRPCGETCEEKCKVKLKDLSLPLKCGHVVSSAFCWETREPDNIRCVEVVSKIVPGCGHKVDVPCHCVMNDTYRCGRPCGARLPCGHECLKKCSTCRTREAGRITCESHGKCVRPCERQSTTCQHTCRKPCHDGVACGSCEQPCEVKCSHSTCSKICCEPCTPCAKSNCASRCPHSKCTMPCAAPCDWIPCSKRCDANLACGHRCPSLCGETCPDPKFCQECGGDDVKAAVVDFIEGTSYANTDLDQDPCIFPDCGHFFTRSSMDGVMDMARHYKMSATSGEPVSITPNPGDFGMDEAKGCPSCRGSLRNVARYGRIVRRALLDEAVRRFITWSKTECARLGPLVLEEKKRLQENVPNLKPMPGQNKQLDLSAATSREAQAPAVHKWLLGSNRYKSTCKLRRDLDKYLGQVRREEQPFQRVTDLVQYAKKQRQTKGEFIFDEAHIQFDTILEATMLLIRCDLLIMSDLLRLVSESAWYDVRVKLHLDPHIRDCGVMVKEADRLNKRRLQVEGHVLLIQLCTIARLGHARAGKGQAPSDGDDGQLSDEDMARVGHYTDLAERHILAAESLMSQHPSTERMRPELDAAKLMARDGVFYAPVSEDEMRAVYAAMATEFQGTGHWYLCQNGHRFTIGECGMAMQLAQCPECGAPVGGQHHQSVEGVVRDDVMERLGAWVGRFGLGR